jgi:hypothetical protein
VLDLSLNAPKAQNIFRLHLLKNNLKLRHLGGYIYKIIINPLLEVLGAAGYEFLDYKIFDYDR